MSGYANFAIVGAGNTGRYIVEQLLKEKAAGTVKEVLVLTRQVKNPSNNYAAHDMLSTPSGVDLRVKGPKTTVQADAKVFQVDYSNDESIKHALTGVDVVISTISGRALDIQVKVAAAAKEVNVKLFVPSEFAGFVEGESEGIRRAKLNVQDQLKALGMPYAAFYTGLFPDYIWVSFFELDVTSGKVSVGGDGNKQIPFTSRPDVARYISYVLTQLPPEQLKNRSFAIAGDNKSFNEIFKAYEEKTGKKLEVTYVSISELDTRIATNPKDIVPFLHKYWVTDGPFKRTDNDLYPNWNPSSVIENMLIA